MKYKIWLLMLNTNDDEKLRLLEKYKSEKEIYDNIENILLDERSLFPKNYVLDKEKNLEISENIYKWMQKLNIGLVTINSKEYPEKLKQIKCAPYGLFYKGNIKLLMGRMVAIVGSRSCSSYGQEVTKVLTKELNSFNITIVSGGAKGIDSCAHSTSLENSGNTIVVLGCGIDVVYPYQNKSLFKEIEEKGLIITEFLPGTRPLKQNFPRRNRIISGLSDAVLVIEAREKSGSLITANYAMEQGREVMAVPGSIFSKGSVGCNRLLRDGAQVFSSIEDLYTLLRLSAREKNRIISPIKQKILSIVSDEPIYIDDLIKESFIDREELFNVLFDMQIKKEIISLPGNYYAKIM